VAKQTHFMTIQELKQELCLSDKDIAKIFGLKNLVTYQNSSAKVRYETALCRFFEVVKEKLNVDEKSDLNNP